MSYVRWNDIRAAQVERAGGEEAVEAGKQELLAAVIGHRLAELGSGLLAPGADRQFGEADRSVPLNPVVTHPQPTPRSVTHLG